MNITYAREQRLLILQLTEEIDHHTTEIIRKKADLEIQRYIPRNTIIDFNSVTFMDSAGIGMLIGRYKILMILNGNLGLINVKSNIRKIFEMCGITKIIPIYENLEDALTNIKAS